MIDKWKYIIKRYSHLWWLLVQNSVGTQVATSLGSAGYLIGKVMRFVLFLIYMLAIFRRLPGLHGYGPAQVVLFFMTFNLIDVGSQFLFRGMYGIKYLIEEGDFDKILTQPANPLFRISSMGVDLLDLLTLIPIGIVFIITCAKLPPPIKISEVLGYFFFLANGMVLSFSFHLFVGALSVRTQEMEGAIWIYRDVMTLGRFPVSIYSEWLRLAFVTLFPIGVMISFPSQALLGLLSWWGGFYAIMISGLFYYWAQKFWKRSLQTYTSISS